MQTTQNQNRLRIYKTREMTLHNNQQQENMIFIISIINPIMKGIVSTINTQKTYRYT